MIVKYVREREYKGSGVDESLTLGKDYLVLGIIMEPALQSNGKKEKPSVYIQCDDDNEPAVFDLDCFDIIDPRIPDGWVFSRVELYGDKEYWLQPKEFEGDFWRKFHDGEPSEIEKILRKHRGEEDIDAQSIFKEVVKKIQVFHGLLVEKKEPEDPYAWPFEEYK